MTLSHSFLLHSLHHCFCLRSLSLCAASLRNQLTQKSISCIGKFVVASDVCHRSLLHFIVSRTTSVAVWPCCLKNLLGVVLADDNIFGPARSSPCCENHLFVVLFAIDLDCLAQRMLRFDTLKYSLLRSLHGFGFHGFGFHGFGFHGFGFHCFGFHRFGFGFHRLHRLGFHRLHCHSFHGLHSLPC